MAAAHWLNSLGCLLLSLLCLLATTLQVTSVHAGEATESTAEALLADPTPTNFPKCDRTFVSRGGASNGTFTAPELHNPYNQSRQCLFTFLAAPGQRVLVEFRTFDLRGKPPDGAALGELPACMHEYMDIYSEMSSLETGELVNSAFGGRYCGPIPPRRRVSLHRAVALAFFTDHTYTPSTLFYGIYRFINSTEFEVGTPIPNTLCSYVIDVGKRKTGLLVSPTYPGIYPKDITCNYQFVGQPGQRIRLEFRDFDLFFGGPHCPFDWVRVYDGPDNTSAIIGTYCGQQRNLVLYSSDERLLVTFFTLPRAANTQNRGFKGIFEFSESFVKLDFISKHDAEHIRGSECDQKILSKKESSGFVYHPNYPFPYIQKVVCRYFIYGMQDSQNLERVRLEFQNFSIPKDNSKPDTCSDGYLKVYLRGQEATDSYDKHDAELCGDGDVIPSFPPPLLSDGPRLVLVFSSGELQGRGFKAKYTFETEYRVPGTAAPGGECAFTYRSEAKKRGEFNSPRYPSNYPSHTNCTYTLVATPNEQVTVVFDHFKVRADAWNATAGLYGGATCSEDWLEAWWTGREGTRVPLGRWCGLATPGPLQSPRGALGLLIALHTDSEAVASGFKARYVFEPAKSIFGDCGGNVSGSPWGVVSSPRYPLPYEAPARGAASRVCNWFITAKPGRRLLLNFDHFAVEGHLTERGCPAAVLRLWYESPGPPLELCGEKAPGDRWQYLSSSNSIRLSFIIADKSVGAAGWRAVWTEVTVGVGEECPEVCGGACLPPGALCSGLPHCAGQHKSPRCEDAHPADSDGSTVWWVAGCAGGGFVTLGVCWRRRRRVPRGPPPPPRPPPRPLAARLAAPTDTV
ncbi:dorsal-ventral patterning tolloid-like protein 1 isoform X1 [Pieris rapae]|uniref:dorsal-ventral patterning tolloid-like protein 1 isoform X1 n=2 Tax=Pieris rapae TaxID=64459 RepID=UPI001E27C79C|nr:dorsal-ventral patterning tolloid-like protein 1 isoform X1 [Pieris rapae]